MGLYPSGGVYPSGPVAPPPSRQSPVTSDELAQLRTDLESVLPGTAVIYRPGTVHDGHGGWVESWAEQEACAAVLHPLDAGEERYGEQLRGRQGYVLTVPASAQLSTAMRVDYEGSSLLVVGVVEWGPNRISRRAVCVRTD